MEAVVGKGSSGAGKGAVATGRGPVEAFMETGCPTKILAPTGLLHPIHAIFSIARRVLGPRSYMLWVHKMTLKMRKKIVAGWGFASDPAEGAYDAPQTPGRLGREIPRPSAPPNLCIPLKLSFGLYFSLIQLMTYGTIYDFQKNIFENVV